MTQTDKSYIKKKVRAQGIIPPGSFILEKGEGFVGTIIKDITHGVYTHVEIVVDNSWWGEKLVHFTIGAQAGGVQCNMLKYLWAQGKPIDFDVYAPVMPYTPDELRAGLDYIESEMFIKYDYAGLLHFIPLIGRLFTPNAKKPICSELASRFLIAAGKFPADFKPEDCSPVSFALTPWVKKITVEI
jgi:hypothetical protein